MHTKAGRAARPLVIAALEQHPSTRGKHAGCMREHKCGCRPERAEAPARRQRCASPCPPRSGVVIGHTGCPPSSRLRESPVACCRPDPRRPASAHGSRSRGEQPPSPTPDLAPGPDDLAKRRGGLRGDSRSVVEIVHLISLAERRPRACSVENAEVGLEHDQRELHHRIAWLSERLAAGTALTGQIRPKRYDLLAVLELAAAPSLGDIAEAVRPRWTASFSFGFTGVGSRVGRCCCV